MKIKIQIWIWTWKQNTLRPTGHTVLMVSYVISPRPSRVRSRGLPVVNNLFCEQIIGYILQQPYPNLHVDGYMINIVFNNGLNWTIYPKVIAPYYLKMLLIILVTWRSYHFKRRTIKPVGFGELYIGIKQIARAYTAWTVWLWSESQLTIFLLPWIVSNGQVFDLIQPPTLSCYILLAGPWTGGFHLALFFSINLNPYYSRQRGEI